MGKQLQITLASGDKHQVDLQPYSMLTVRTRVQNETGQLVDTESSWSNVDDVKVVETKDVGPPQPNLVQESPHLSSPQTVLQFAKVGPAADAAQVVEQAKDRYKGDKDVAEADRIVSARIQSGGDSEPYVDVDATPAAADLASEKGVDLTTVEGSGAGGTVTKADVAAAAEWK